MDSPHSRQRPSNDSGWTGSPAFALRMPSSTREADNISAISRSLSSMVFSYLSDKVIGKNAGS